MVDLFDDRTMATVLNKIGITALAVPEQADYAIFTALNHERFHPYENTRKRRSWVASPQGKAAKGGKKQQESLLILPKG